MAGAFHRLCEVARDGGIQPDELGWVERCATIRPCSDTTPASWSAFLPRGLASCGVGYPYAAVYGATKAALIAWGNATRVELEGKGVGVTTVSPGYVKGAGMFAAHYVKPPASLGETTPEAVAQAVVRALREDPIGIDVSPRPFWPVQAMFAAAPRQTLALFRRLGVLDYMKRMLDKDLPPRWRPRGATRRRIRAPS